MLFSGKSKGFSGPKTKIQSHLIRAFEEARCEVTREKDQLVVYLPGWDIFLQPFTARFNLHRIFWDQIKVGVNDEGTVSYELNYWSTAQSLLHLMITCLFSFEYCFGKMSWTLPQFLLIAAFANGVPALCSLANFRKARQTVLGKVRKRLSVEAAGILSTDSPTALVSPESA